MKKAKIVLSAVALFAVVGGAFAFKAARFGQGNVYYTTTTLNGATTCAFANTIKTTAVGTVLTTVYTSRNAAGICTNLIPDTYTTVTAFAE